jgi:hypothetical protein
MGKPNADAGQELHKRATQGLAQRFACHEAFTITQAIDLQRNFLA